MSNLNKEMNNYKNKLSLNKKEYFQEETQEEKVLENLKSGKTVNLKENCQKIKYLLKKEIKNREILKEELA